METFERHTLGEARDSLPPPLMHLAFFEAAGRVPSDLERRGLRLANVEETFAYRASIAGLLTMRLVDHWLTAAAGGPAPSRRELDAVQRAVASVPPSPMREILNNLYGTLTSSWGDVARHIPVILCAYAVILKKEEWWACAADVYATMATLAPLCGAEDMVAAAYLDMGYCYRMIGGRLVEAERAYARAGAVANLRGDEYNAVLSRVGLANVYLDRGNLPLAQDTLDRVIKELVPQVTDSNSALVDVLARARHDRAHVAYQRRDYVLAAELLHTAVRDYVDESRKSRALIDLGITMGDLGLIDAARDAHLIAHQTAPEAYVRWAALINLLELAYKHGQETVFERFRQQLAQIALPARLEATYYRLVGEGLLRFGRNVAARDALRRAVDVATRYQLNQLRMEAEALLESVAIGQTRYTAVIAATAGPAPATVQPVVQALREMRERADAYR